MIYNFPTHINGDTFDGVTFNLKINGVAVDLTGCVIKMQLRKQPGLPPVLEISTQTSPLTIVITDAVGGVFEIPQQNILVYCPDIYKYDIQFTFPDGSVRTYVEGVWNIKNDITT